jgi:hypothetical protein
MKDKSPTSLCYEGLTRREKVVRADRAGSALPDIRSVRDATATFFAGLLLAGHAAALGCEPCEAKN